MKEKSVNKIKVLLICNCGECKHVVVSEYYDSTFYLCGLVNHETIIDLNTFPSWCPLPDAPEDPHG